MGGGIEEHTSSSEAPLALGKKLGFRGGSDSLGRFTGLQFLNLYRRSVPAAVPKGPDNNCSGACSSHTGLGGFSVTNLSLAHTAAEKPRQGGRVRGSCQRQRKRTD